MVCWERRKVICKEWRIHRYSAFGIILNSLNSELYENLEKHCWGFSQDCQRNCCRYPIFSSHRNNVPLEITSVRGPGRLSVLLPRQSWLDVIMDCNVLTFPVGWWACSENTECSCQVEHQKLKHIKSTIV